MDMPATASVVSSPPTGGTALGNEGRRLLASAVNAINQTGMWPGTALKIHVDTATRSLTVQIINSQTEEVLSQIPSEQALRMASELGGAATAANDW
jgi:uncharacterized FlaG/YvyC family protein